jgi:hypothetical protein
MSFWPLKLDLPDSSKMVRHVLRVKVILRNASTVRNIKPLKLFYVTYLKDKNELQINFLIQNTLLSH